MMRFSLCFLTIISFFACKDSKVSLYQQIDGSTMGTYYVIKCPTSRPQIKQEIDSLLTEFNLQLSTYIDSSIISQINKEKLSSFNISKSHIRKTFETSKMIFENSKGDFDPTIAVLTNYWGFGYTGRKPITKVDSTKVSILLDKVGFQKTNLSCNNQACKLDRSISGIKFDFNAIAKGQGVDAIADYLRGLGISDFLVDIGGEQVLSGVNSKGEDWSIGLNNPTEDSNYRDIVQVLQLSNAAIASSGNYRSFYEVDGKKYSHTINPHTGYPERSNLLAVTVIAETCILADAYATTCMVKGLDNAIKFIDALPNTEAVFFYNNRDTLDIAMSENFQPYIKEE